MFEKEAEELFKKKPLGYEMKPELEIYKDGFKDGATCAYNKANEWHYVKDGDYPKNDDDVLVLLKDETVQVDYYFSKIGWNISLKADVIAWKEIVLPKESE